MKCTNYYKILLAKFLRRNKKLEYAYTTKEIEFLFN